MTNVDVDSKPQGISIPVPQPAGPPKRSVAKLVLPGILLALVCLVPFLNKAYTVDDPNFLLAARQILHHPLRPMSYPLCWGATQQCTDNAGVGFPGSAQALMGYLLVPVILAGGAEWMAHLLQILLACLAVLAMVGLALRLGFDRVQAAVAGLMLVAIPPFLSMASTAMPDTAALALGLSGIERLLAWKAERRWHQAVIASLALGLAPYARPHMALLIPLGGLWLVNDLRMRDARRQFRLEGYLWLPVLIAACILAAVNLLTHDPGSVSRAISVSSASLPSGAWRPIRFEHLPRNLGAYLLYLSFPIPFAAVWLAMHWRKAPMLLVLPAVSGPILHSLLFQSRSLVLAWPMVAELYGFAAIGSMLHQCVRAWDRIGLLLSLWLLIPFPLIIYDHLPIKYLLAVTPAVVFILIRNLSILPRRRELSAYGAIVLACAAYSFVLLRADADFAECGRRAAAELIKPHVAAGEKVWFGGEWGFYWYAQEAGAKFAKPDEAGPNPGDLLAVGLMEHGKVTRRRFPKRKLIDSRRYDAPHGRTMGYGAGLYSNFMGYSLWVWKPETTNDYELWRIE